MAARIKAADYNLTQDLNVADAIIINTCSFIQSATEESIEVILDSFNVQNVLEGKAHVIVCGCMVSRYGSDLNEELPEASAFVACSDEDTIVDVLDKLFHNNRNSIPSPGYPQQLDGDCVSAYVKISDGCDRFCSYCTIPFIRGRYHSFSYESIAQNVEAHVRAGIQEIVLIAQDTGRWGNDFDKSLSLAWLLEHLATNFPTTWFRVMYLQPEGITDELLNVMARFDNICSYLDIPFQHCEEHLLKDMNRRGSKNDYIKLVSSIREKLPHVVLRTTLIVGFPGETEEDFESLCEFVEEIQFDYVGLFAFSPEEGTKAAGLSQQIDDDTKQERLAALRDISDSISNHLISERIGRHMPVLVCGTEDDGQLFGRSQGQAPDVDGVTFLNTGEVGQIEDALIIDTFYYDMEAEVVYEH